MKKIFVKELEKGEFEDIFIVNRIKKKERKDGGFFYELYISDKTGEMKGYVFDNIAEFEKKLKEGVYQVKGEARELYGEIVFTLKELKKARDVEIKDLFPSSPREIDRMVNNLENIITDIQNPHLKKLLDYFFNDPEIRENFINAPAAKKMHHAYIGGLLEHTLNVVEIAESLAESLSRMYSGLSKDILITGALLHDIGKIKTYEYRAGIDISDKGRLLDHVYFSLIMVQEKIDKISDFPENLKLRILHMIASHHGEKSMGALTEPMTEEALLLHFADYIDTLMFKFKRARENSKEGARWSEYQRDLQRFIFLGGEEE
jgi:3'-5' exoribonuclease